MYKSIDIDREKLTIMFLQFSDITSLESAANAIGTNMFEGFEPSRELYNIMLIGKVVSFQKQIF